MLYCQNGTGASEEAFYHHRRRQPLWIRIRPSTRELRPFTNAAHACSERTRNARQLSSERYRKCARERRRVQNVKWCRAHESRIRTNRRRRRKRRKEAKVMSASVKSYKNVCIFERKQTKPTNNYTATLLHIHHYKSKNLSR